MKRNQLGRSDIHVTEVGFGCMSIGTDKPTAISLLEAAYDEGIRFFDTADLYDQGLNEEFVGETFQNRRHHVVIATKVGNKFEVGKPGWTWDVSPAYIKGAIERSLKRLRTDYIDLYQIHGGTMEDDFEAIVETMESFKSRGLIRAYGISSIRPNVIQRYLKGSNLDSIMMQYSLLDRRPEEWFDEIARHHVSVIARGPVCKGLLSPLGKTLGADESYLNHDATAVAHAKAAVDRVSSDSRSANQTALQYALRADVVSSAIPGASRKEQVAENAGAGTAPRLTFDAYQELQQAIPAYKYAQHRP